MNDDMHVGAIPVAETDAETRATFITRTYSHVGGALLSFIGIECALFATGLAREIAIAVAGHWYVVLGAFILVGWLASMTAARARSLPVQYSALAAYVAIEAVIFTPLLYVANAYAPGVLTSAAGVTAAGTVALTAIVFWMRKDFSFLGGILRWGGFCALGAIIAGAIFGFNLGTWFSVAMIALAGGSILYTTSRVMLDYPADRYVSAALELFAGIMLLFWYVLRLFLSSRD